MNKYWALAFALIIPTELIAGTCDTAWDGDKFMTAMRGSPLSRTISLRNKEATVASVTVGQVQAFHDAKDRISRLSGSSPSFILCGDSAVNAFAGNGGSGQVIGVTVGMLKLVDGDPDMAAAVIGHEISHHDKGHGAAAQSRNAMAGLIGLIVGAALESRVQRNKGVSGLGIDLGNIGATLVSRNFDRDQEREADQGGLDYMVRAGFNPNGAIQLARRMNQAGSGGVGLFFDSHPGWSEREDNFRLMIVRNPEAQRLAIAPATPRPSSGLIPQGTEQTSIASSYTTSDAQKSYSSGLIAFRARDFPTALREMTTASESGFAPAQAAAGYLLFTGQGGIPKNESEAARLFRLSANQGNAAAQSYLGRMYATGLGGLPKDDAEAVRLYRLAADQGNADGRTNLAIMYFNGRGGLIKDEVEAARLYRLATDQGNANAQVYLGVLYLNGRSGVAKDDAEAARLIRLAANQGNSYGLAMLGVLNTTGRGVPKDDAIAANLFRQAADLGQPIGQAGLGDFYENGKGGLSRDLEAAVSLYRLSAKQGMPQAIAALKRLGRE
jgi:TPR repeat protein/Zn-dependent protease with chaperone function